jgi:hypothetical protein
MEIRPVCDQNNRPVDVMLPLSPPQLTTFERHSRVSPFDQSDDSILGPRGEPHYDLSSPNIRCGRDAGGTGPLADVATVVAGTEVGVRPDLWNAPVSPDSMENTVMKKHFTLM